LYQHYQQESFSNDFWQSQSVESIVASQQLEPLSDITMLKADFWPEDESADEFIGFVEQQHQEDRLTN